MLTKKTRIPARKKSAKKAHGSPRKQPSQARSQETVAVILEAAARVLESRGLEGYNTNAVAERAGVSVGSIYQYFPNKDALTLALIHLFEEELHTAVRQTAAETEGKTLRTALAAFIRSHYQVHQRRAALHRILELEEERLGVPESAAKDSLRSFVLRLLKTHRAVIHAPLSAAVEDIITISRSMTDEALQKNLKPAAAERRTLRALYGYLLWDERAA